MQSKVDGVGTAWTEFAWQDDGLFLRQVCDDGVTWNLDFELTYTRVR